MGVWSTGWLQQSTQVPLVMMMHSSPALTSHARIFINARRRIGARRPYIRAQASSVDGAMERIVAWTALDVENKRTLNSGVPESIQRDIDALIADGRVDGGIENAVQGDGVWEVFSAPHIKRLAAPVGVIFSPLRYVIDQGNIYSHVRHRGIVPDGWLSASGVVVQGVDMLCQGRMRPSCVIWFDKFWIGASSQTKDEPREFPTENEASALDVAINKIGNAGFLDGLARFPLLFYDEKQGLVIFQFPPLNSNICAMRRN